MPFGLKNSAATFQRMMNKIIAGLLGTDCYIDDIVVYSMSWESHLEYLRALFERLLEFGLTRASLGRLPLIILVMLSVMEKLLQFNQRFKVYLILKYQKIKKPS